jgi:secondary thiamine-phosphate synthase enzyme
VKSATFSIDALARHRHGFVDVTDDLRRAIKDAGVTSGCAVAFCAHTTCALIINEWEDGVLQDLTSRLERLVPHDEYFAHDDLARRTQNLVEEERVNGQAHVLQMLIGGSSHAIPVVDGEPALGTWQRIFLLELDEPKERHITCHVFGS